VAVLPALVVELFGLRHMGFIFGLVIFGVGIGATIGPVLAGHIYTVTGSYCIAFLVGAIAMFISTIIVPLLKRPRM
jgi:OFA family oxalate/formate antiporter-like MFS transporter